MSLTMLMAAAATLAAPIPKTLLMSHEDFTPDAARYQDSVTYVLATIEVSPQGKALSCTLHYSSAVKSMTQRVCALAMKRGRFTPAVDTSGQPIFGLYRHRLRFVNPNVPGRASNSQVGWPPIFSVTLPRWPDSAPSGPEAPVTIVAEVDDKGSVAGCGIGQDSGSAVLSELACRLIRDRQTNLPTTPRDGAPVRYVTEFSIGFDVASPELPSPGPPSPR